MVLQLVLQRTKSCQEGHAALLARPFPVAPGTRYHIPPLQRARLVVGLPQHQHQWNQGSRGCPPRVLYGPVFTPWVRQAAVVGEWLPMSSKVGDRRFNKCLKTWWLVSVRLSLVVYLPWPVWTLVVGQVALNGTEADEDQRRQCATLFVRALVHPPSRSSRWYGRQFTPET
jgi:hypothetical protein